MLAFADPDRYLARYREPDKIAFGLGDADAWPVKFWETDTAMACMLLLLAAVDAGLGGWLFGVAHGEADVLREFGVPADRKLIAAIGLGYPGVDETPARLGLHAGPPTVRRDGPPQPLVAGLSPPFVSTRGQ